MFVEGFAISVAMQALVVFAEITDPYVIGLLAFAVAVGGALAGMLRSGAVAAPSEPAVETGGVTMPVVQAAAETSDVVPVNADTVTPEAGGPASDARYCASVNKQLPASGRGYYSIGNRPAQYGAEPTIVAIEKWGEQYAYATGGERIGIGNISVEGGGPFPPHLAHRTGYDVDIRVPRSDLVEVGTTWMSTEYSPEKTQILVNIIHGNPDVAVILFNDPKISGVAPWVNHDDHLHCEAQALTHLSVFAACSSRKVL